MRVARHFNEARVLQLQSIPSEYDIVSLTEALIGISKKEAD